MTRYKTEEARNKARSRKKDYDKRAKIKDPLYDLGDHIKKSAKNRKLEAPHAPLEYKNWYIQQVKKCYFCGNDNETIKKYLEKIGEKITKQQNRLGIDRMDSSKGYLLENLTLACSICNTHKSDIISADDFKEIARDYITPKIKKTI
jgi:5-methylcytosine-specific restriction endonuclease McrA